jgi:signal transduction histidine kinase
MRFFRRSILWLLAIVIVPLGALLVMQYRFLRALEENTASAERNWLRNSLEKITEDMEIRYRHAATAALTMNDGQLADVRTIGWHFATHSVPGARTFFAIRFRHGMAEVGYFDTRGKEKVPSEAEAEAVKLSTVAWHVAHKWNRVLAQPSLAVDERDPQNRIILRPVIDESLHVVGISGVILDEKLASAAMTNFGKRVIDEGRPESMLSILVRKEFPRTARKDRDYITQPLGFVFTDWRAGIRDVCSSPEEMAAYKFRNNMMWTGGAFVVLLGSVGLAMHAVARQMRLSQMKSDFVSNVSHELRTPISSIRVFGEYMRLGRVDKPEKVREYGEYIEAESRRLTQLINNILDFSKIESAEKNYHFCETDLAALVEQTVSAFVVPLRDQGVTVAFSVAGAPPPPLLVDKDAIAQALMNLLDNAVKYSNGRKEIEVHLAAGAGEVRISVRDHGIGIPDGEKKKIFEKFYRVGSGLVHDVKGSGLGLSIVQHVVKAHGGRVEVTSEPGEGSTFTIVLPGVVQASRPASAAASEAGLESRTTPFPHGDHA